MNTNNRRIASQAIFTGISSFIVLCLWDWIESGNSRLLVNGIAGVLAIFGSVFVDKVLLKQ